MEARTPSPDQSGTEARVLGIVRELLTELRSDRALKGLGLDASLERDLGLGSLERVELLTRLERDFKVHFPDHILHNTETVSDLVTAIISCQQSRPKGSPLEFRVYSPTESKRTDIPTAEGLPNSGSGFFCGLESPETLVQALTLYARHDPKRIHVYLRQGDNPPQTINYGDLLDSSLAVASGILDRGVERGETVALMLPTCAEFLWCFLGILMAGCVPVPIYPPFRPDRLEEYAHRQEMILQNARVRLLITFEGANRLARLLRPGIPSLEDVVTHEDFRGARSGLVAQAAQPNEIALIQYTSGSTGDPKGVVLTHRNLVANIQSAAQGIQLKPTDLGVSWLPLYHDMGLIGFWLSSLYFGIPITLMSPLDFLNRPERWLWAIHFARATLSVAPNFAYELAARRIPIEALSGLDLSCWRGALNGAEPVSPQTLRRFSDRFRRYGFREETLLPVYGLAECAVALAFPPLGRQPRIDTIARELFASTGRAEPAPDSSVRSLQFVSVGRAIPEHEIRIVDDSGRKLPERTQGRIQFRGPSMMQGYFRNPEATRHVMCDGWIDSGDLGYEAEGELYVTGRSKDVIIKAGRNFYPQEIEEIVGAIPGIRQGCIAAFGISHPMIGTEQLVIVAETRKTKRDELEQLRAEVVNRVDSSLGLPPDIVEFVPPQVVPKTSSGKIRRDACRKFYLEGKLRQSRRPSWFQMFRIAVSSVKGNIRKHLDWILKGLYGCYAWSVLGVVGLPCWVALWFVPTRNSGRSRYLYRKLCRLTLSLAGLKPELEGVDHLAAAVSWISEGKSLLLLSNHSSYADALVLGAVLPFDFRFVVKSEAASWPLVGKFVRKGDYFLVHRYDAFQLTSDFEKLVMALKDGTTVHIFPEGTFTRACGLRPFQIGAFKLAVGTGCPLLPITLSGVRQVLPEGSWIPKRHRIRVVVGPLLVPQTGELAEQVRLRSAVREEFLRHCGEGALDLVVAGPPRE